MPDGSDLETVGAGGRRAGAFAAGAFAAEGFAAGFFAAALFFAAAFGVRFAAVFLELPARFFMGGNLQHAPAEGQ